ncbi:MAG: hypothetical protein IJW21_04080 [Clostridia bacterium]|nr:hypothetical protein [Clostridia bacterium]
MKKDKKQMDKKAYTVFTAVAIGLFVLAFALLAGAGIVQDSGSDKIAGVLGGSFFVLLIADLVFILANIKRVMEYEFEAKTKKIETGGFATLANVTEAKILAALQEGKFTLHDGEYYHKRKFSFGKDVINYFVKCAEYENLNETLTQELDKFENKDYKHTNKCLLLFLFADEVTEEDRADVMEISKNLISLETTLSLPQFDTSVIIAVDKMSRKAYFVPINKTSISVYAHGVKMIKKLFAGE